MIRYARIATPLGMAFATSLGDNLTGLYFEGARRAPDIAPQWREDPGHSPLRECARQLADYFAGRRRSFELALAPGGTSFQRRVWIEIARIPYGQTLSYGELAALCGAPAAARAAGAATGRNPLSIIVPCHRVVGSNGELTGYAGGLPRKTRLLELERAPQAMAA